MRERFWSVVAIIGAIFIVIALAVPAYLAVIGQNNDRPVGTVAFDPETDYIPSEALCVDNHYMDNSIRTVKAGDDDFRQFPDAVSTPFKATTGEGVRAEYLAEGCGNATLLSQDVDEMLLWTDQDVPGADQNKEWLQEIKDYITLNGLDAFNAKTADGVKIVTPKFQTFRSWVNTVWLRFTFADAAKPVVSDRNYEVSPVASPKTQPVPYVASTQDKRPSWRATLMGKNNDCIASEWLNDLDKRIVHSSEDNCKPTPPKGSDCVGTPCGGSTPPPVLDCPSVYPQFPHGTYPDCKDDQGNSPYENGAGGTGGGPPATSGPGDVTVLQPTTNTPRVDPTPPAPAPVPSSDPQPVPSAEPSAAPTNNPATVCSPPPGMTTCP